MDIVPPPMDSKPAQPSSSSTLEGTEDDDEGLFAVVGQPKKSGIAITASNTSGYESADPSTNDAVNILSLEDDIQVARSNTMDDFQDNGGVNVDLDDDDDDMFKSARGLEPEPMKRDVNLFGDDNSDTEPVALDNSSPDKEIPLEDEDEKPFEDVHLKPQLQLSAGQHSAVSAVTNNTNGNESKSTGATSFGVDNNSITPTNMDAPTESFKNSATAATSLNGMNSNGTGIVDINLDSEERDEFIDIKVTSPHKVGEGMSSYMAYKVSTKTNVNYFKNSEMAVDRRFSDFLGLHDKLSEKYLQNGRIIPPAPDKSLVGMTKVKMSKEANPDTPVQQDEFVEKRRAALERFLNRTAIHASLRTDPDFREFLELETELPKASQTAMLSGKSVMKMINSVGDRITNITLKLEETDDWFEEKNNTIEQLETQLRKLHQSTELLVMYRKDLGFATNFMSKSLDVLSGTEENSGLSGAIAQLSSVQEKIAKIHQDQATVEFFELSELIKDYLGLVGAVKNVFNERVKAWQSWQGTSARLTKRREAKVKAELGQKMDMIATLRQEIAELEREQDMAQENFDRISRLIRKEVEVFDFKKAEDFKKTIIKYLESMLSAQEQIAEQWERYLPEIKVVNV